IGHLYVHKDHVRLKLGGTLDYLLPGSSLANHLHLGLRAEHGAQSFPNHAVVVCYEDADGALHGDEIAPLGFSSVVGSGRRASTRVPSSGPGSASRVPPSSSARSRMEESPTPAMRSLGIPTPSSVISTSSIPALRSIERRTWQVLAWAWRT